MKIRKILFNQQHVDCFVVFVATSPPSFSISFTSLLLALDFPYVSLILLDKVLNNISTPSPVSALVRMKFAFVDCASSSHIVKSKEDGLSHLLPAMHMTTFGSAWFFRSRNHEDTRLNDSSFVTSNTHIAALAPL